MEEPPGICLYRSGGKEAVVAPLVDKPDMLNTQTCLPAVVNRALAGDNVQLLLSSLSADTQTMYRKGVGDLGAFLRYEGYLSLGEYSGDQLGPGHIVFSNGSTEW